MALNCQNINYCYLHLPVFLHINVKGINIILNKTKQILLPARKNMQISIAKTIIKFCILHDTVITCKHFKTVMYCVRVRHL